MTGHRRLLTMTLAALLALGAAAASATGSPPAPGGAAPGVLYLPDGSPLTVKLGNPLVRASGDGLTVAVRSTALLRGRMRLTGTAPRSAGTVTIERRDPLTGWIPVASAAVAADGGFVAVWRPNRLGPLQLRAVAGAPAAGIADDNPAGAELGVTVYRPGIASWYGPTAPDQTTACGVPLTDATLGVAHRTLPCGTPVSFYYKGVTITVPVIDRGPFASGRSWDLTAAAFNALGGDDGLIRVGALPQPPPAAPVAAQAR